MASSVRGREQDSRDRDRASRDAEETDTKEKKVSGVLRNTPKLFQTLFDHKRWTNDERNRGGTRKVKSDNNFKELSDASSQVFVTQSPAQVFLRSDPHTDWQKSVRSSCTESISNTRKEEKRRKNTLSSGEVTVIVKHDFETLSAMGENNLKRQKYVTVTNVFRWCSLFNLFKGLLQAI